MFSQVYDSLLNFACFHKLLTEAATTKWPVLYLHCLPYGRHVLNLLGKTFSKCTRKHLLEVYLKRSFLLLFKDPVISPD